MRIRKAVLPVAGLGTRVLPATKAIPKELLPVVDRPVIQYVVDEALEAGIEHIIFVTGRGKTAIVEHFDHAFELETTMRDRHKDLDVLEPTRIEPGNLVAVRQQVPMGLGHAIWCARAIVGDEPFAILLPDELMIGTPGCMKQMIAAYNEVGGNLISVLERPRAELSSLRVTANPRASPEIAPRPQSIGVGAATNIPSDGRIFLQSVKIPGVSGGESGAKPTKGIMPAPRTTDRPAQPCFSGWPWQGSYRAPPGPIEPLACPEHTRTRT